MRRATSKSWEMQEVKENISTHALHAESDVLTMFLFPASLYISTHALHAESDVQAERIQTGS